MATKLSAYTRRMEDAGPVARPSKQPTECAANGCPMPGVFRLTNDTSVCRAHDGIPGHDWPAITERVNLRWRPLQTAMDLTNSEPHLDPAPQVVARFVQMGGADYERKSKFYGFPDQKTQLRGTEPETARDYGSRVFRLMMTEIRGDKARLQSEQHFTDDEPTGVAP